MEINIDNPFTTGYVLNYKEGDSSLERDKVKYTPSPNDKLHPVTNWDNLSDLSFDYYKTSKYWWVIADANPDIIDPFDLTPNTNIIIPDLSRVLASIK